MLEALPSGQRQSRDVSLAALTIPISWSSNSLCCSKKDFSAGGAPVDDDGKGLFVLDAILVDILEETRGVVQVGERGMDSRLARPNPH